MEGRFNIVLLGNKQYVNFNVIYFISTSSQITESLATELQRTFVSKTFLREERKHVENMKQNFSVDGFENAASFYDDMLSIMEYIDRFAGPNNSTNNDGNVGQPKKFFFD